MGVCSFFLCLVRSHYHCQTFHSMYHKLNVLGYGLIFLLTWVLNLFLIFKLKICIFYRILNGLLFKLYFTMLCKIMFFLTIHYARQQHWKHNVKVQIITLWGFCNFHPNKHTTNLKCHQKKLLFKLNVCEKPWLCQFGYLKPFLLAFYG